MSVLAATTLRERASAKDVPVETVRQGAVKAWGDANLTTTPASLTGSFNTSSLSDNGVGDVTANFTTPLVSASYSYALGRDGVAGISTYTCNVTARTVSTCRFITQSASSVADAGSAAYGINGSLS